MATYLATQITSVGIFSVAMAEDGTGGTEFDAADYARQAVTMVVDAGNPDRIYNHSGAVAFGTPLTNWGTAVQLVGYNDYGTAVAYLTIDPTACDADAPVKIPVDALIVRME